MSCVEQLYFITLHKKLPESQADMITQRSGQCDILINKNPANRAWNNFLNYKYENI